MSRARNFKVGLFVLAGLLMSGLVIFLIGDERRLFERSVDFKARFADVKGLKKGAPVQMGGIDIGHVGKVGYGKNPGDATIYVTLAIVESESSRIKTDSVVKVAAKGLLGDKMIEITKGKSAVSVKVGEEITSAEPEDMLGKVGGMASKADAVLTNAEEITKQLADERLHRDLRESVASINVVMKQVSGGDGYPHRLLTDKAEADRISHAVENLDRTSAELAVTMADVRQVVQRVKSGPGFAHDILYGSGPQKQIEQFGGAADELALTLRGIRQSDSLAHDALFGGKGNGAEAISNVNAITGDLRVIVSNMRQGKGTIGALLVDPSVYEDLKVVLGNVQRNDVLRALVRYSIKQDEKKPAVQVGKTP